MGSAIVNDFPLQLFANEDMPRAELFRRITQEPFLNKPRCGLWTSTFIDTEKGSEWIQWCIDERFRAPPDYGWFLRPIDDTSVLQIDSHSDLVSVTKQFTRSPDPKFAHLLDAPYTARKLIDFDAVALEYDGVRVTRNGVWETTMTRPHNLYGWDCEATVWFQWVFDAPEKVQLNVNVDDYDKEWFDEE